jgi:hypothetical protein
LSRRGEGTAINLSDLKERLGNVWRRIKEINHFTYDWKDLISIQDQLWKMTNLVGKHDSVVAVNFPVELEILPNKVVSGSIDGILLKNQDRRNKSLKIISFDYTTFARRLNKSPQLRLLAGYFDMCIRDSEISRLPRKYYFIRVGTGTIHQMETTRYEDKDTLSLLRKIDEAMEHKVEIPTVHVDVCKDCLYNKICDWSQV